MSNNFKKPLLLLTILSVLTLLIYLIIFPLWNKYQALKFLNAEQDSSKEVPQVKFSADLEQKIKSLNNFQQLPKMKEGYRILLTIKPNCIAEFYTLYRLGKVIEEKVWEYAIIENAAKNPEAVNIINPNFVIAIRSDMRPVKGFTNLLLIHSFLSQYVDENENFKENKYGHFLNYEGFLSFLPNLKPIEKYFEDHQKPFKSITSYLSAKKNDFNDSNKTKLCFWGSSLWDKERGSDKYLNLYNALDKKDYFVLYGPEGTWKDKNYQSYKGFLPLENDILINKISEAGIALVLHSHEHIKDGVPTSRIFEALAASAIIISDKHPFIIENFGDNVLYIEQNASADEMFEQIDNHVNWILANPDEAIKKAKASHEIFINKLSLEGELDKIINFVEKELQ